MVIETRQSSQKKKAMARPGRSSAARRNLQISPSPTPFESPSRKRAARAVSVELGDNSVGEDDVSEIYSSPSAKRKKRQQKKAKSVELDSVSDQVDDNDTDVSSPLKVLIKWVQGKFNWNQHKFLLDILEQHDLVSTSKESVQFWQCLGQMNQAMHQRGMPQIGADKLVVIWAIYPVANYLV